MIMEIDKIKESILKAAQDLFRKYGYHKTSVNEIAKKAKIAKATLYKYFESKEVLLHYILMDFIRISVNEIIEKGAEETDKEAYLSNLILETSRLSYTICNEFIGWDFIRESTNAQGFLKLLSDDLEVFLIQSYRETHLFKGDELYAEKLSLIIK